MSLICTGCFKGFTRYVASWWSLCWHLFRRSRYWWIDHFWNESRRYPSRIKKVCSPTLCTENLVIFGARASHLVFIHSVHYKYFPLSLLFLRSHLYRIFKKMYAHVDCTLSSKCWRIKHSDRIIHTLARDVEVESPLIDASRCRWI